MQSYHASVMATSGTDGYDLMYYLKGAAAGGICCSITHGALTPVDVVKTRVQLDPVKVGAAALSLCGRCCEMSFPPERTLFVQWARHSTDSVGGSLGQKWQDVFQYCFWVIFANAPKSDGSVTDLNLHSKPNPVLLFHSSHSLAMHFWLGSSLFLLLMG